MRACAHIHRQLRDMAGDHYGVDARAVAIRNGHVHVLGTTRSPLLHSQQCLGRLRGEIIGNGVMRKTTATAAEST